MESRELLRVLKKGSNPQEEKSDLHEEKWNPQEEKTNLQEEKANRWRYSHSLLVNLVGGFVPVSYTHSPSPRDRQKARMPSSA